MPSSMCWPAGDCRQRSRRSSPRKSTASAGANTPILLIQPPRLVDTLTSGDVVTMRSATPATSPRRVRTRPNVSCVDVVPTAGTLVASGIGSTGRGGTGTLLSSPPVTAHASPAADVGSKRSHSVAGVRPSDARRASICSPDSRAAWFSGSPAIGRPQPFTV